MTSRVTPQRKLLARLQELGKFVDEDEADRALQACLAVVGSLLTPTDREAVATELPHACAAHLSDLLSHPSEDWLARNRRVAQNEGARLGLAIEHVGTVCRTLNEVLSAAARQRLQRALPTHASLFADPEPSDALES